MEIRITVHPTFDLIKIDGRIDSYTAPQIDQSLSQLIQDGRHNFIVDMEDVSYISSSGMLTFVNAKKSLITKQQGTIIFAAAPQRILSGFQLAGFDQLFEFCENATLAAKRF